MALSKIGRALANAAQGFNKIIGRNPTDLSGFKANRIDELQQDVAEIDVSFQRYILGDDSVDHDELRQKMMTTQLQKTYSRYDEKDAWAEAKAELDARNDKAFTSLATG